MKSFRLLLPLLTMLLFPAIPIFAGNGAFSSPPSSHSIVDSSEVGPESGSKVISSSSQTWKEHILERRLLRKSQRLARKAERSRADTKLTLGLISSVGSLALTVLAFALVFTPAILLSLLVLAPLSILGAILGIVLANSVEASYFETPGQVRIIKIFSWLTISIWAALVVAVLTV